MQETTTVSSEGGIVLTETEIKSEMKQKRTRRRTKAEKEKLVLDKAVDKIQQASGESYFLLIDRLDRWLCQNHNRAVQLLSEFSPKRMTRVTYTQFKAAMRDLNIPCTAVELHLLCKLLDFDRNESINISLLSEGLGFVRSHESYYRMQDIQPLLTQTNEKYAHCSKRGCAMAHWNGEPYRVMVPRYLLIHFRLLSFEQFTNHVGHFSNVIPTHTTIFHLTKVISDQTSIVMSRATIFTDKSRDSKAVLLPDLTLEECGFEGGSKDAPNELILFYEYTVDVRDCPILLCDHYLTRKARPRISKVLLE